MSNTLTKTTFLQLDGYTVTVVPSIAPTPAYCIDQVTYVMGYTTYTLTDPVTGVTTSGLVSTGPQPVVTHVCYPATSGFPGSTTSTPNFSISRNLGWTGSAISLDELAADGAYQFSVPQDVIGVVTGFNDVDQGAAYADIDFGLYFASGYFQVIENGVELTTPATYVSSDVFTIRRLGGEVAYFQGSTRIYTSLVRSTGVVFVDASIYAGGDRIVNASLSTSVAATYAAVSGGVHGTLMGPLGFAANVTGGVGSPPPSGPSDPGGGPGTTGGTDANGDWPGRIGGVLRGLVGTAISYNNGGVDSSGGGAGSGGGGSLPNGDYNGRSGGQLRGLVGHAYGSSEPAGTPNPGTYYAVCAGVLNDPSSESSGLSGYAEGNMLQPQFAIADGVLSPLAGFSIALAGMTGTAQGKLGQLHGNSGNVTTAGVGSGDNGGSGSNPATGSGGGSGGVNATGDGDWNGRIGGELRGLVGHAYQAIASFALTTLQDSPTVFAFGHTPTVVDGSGNPAGYGVRGTLNAGLSVKAFGGAALDASFPTPTLTASATAVGLARVRGTFPTPYVTASGTTTGLAHVYATLPRRHYGLAAFGGAVMRGTLKTRYALDSSGGTTGLARVTGRFPRPTLVASGTTGLVARVVGTFPALRPVASGVVLATIGRYELRAEAHVSVAVEYEAYSFTLIDGADNQLHVATTRYTNFPFERIVRFGAKYYGVAADGLYELDGDTFDGTPIVAEVQTADFDFNTPQLKRAVALYLGGRAGVDMDVSVISSELDTNQYTYDARPTAGALNHRVQFGKGIRARYLAFKLSNSAGEDFAIDDMTVELAETKRTLV